MSSQEPTPEASVIDPEVPPTRSRMDLKRVLLVLALVVVGGGVFLFVNGSKEAEPEPGGDEGPDMAELQFRDAGFRLDLPEAWQFFEQANPDPQIVFVAGVPGTQNNLRVRVNDWPEQLVVTDDTPEAVVQELQGHFDDVINEDPAVEVLQRQRVRVHQTQGWHYFYSFVDEQSGEDALHSHFFLTGRNKLYTLVFQALPSSNYEQLARTFDEILVSFELLDQEGASPAPAEPEPTAGE